MKKLMIVLLSSLAISFARTAEAVATFADANTAASHLEADVDATTNVNVWLARNAGEGLSTNVLVSRFPGKAEASMNVIWAAGETNKTVAVAVPSGISTNDGTAATLLLKDNEGNDLATNAIWLVQGVAISCGNPLWIGERTADTLKAGEWTMDLDVAKARTKNQIGDAYTLAVVSGELWCPDCTAARDTLFKTQEFADWLTNHNVALVAIDVPNTTAPTLVSREIYPRSGASGTAYITRKMISDADAAATFERNWLFRYVTWNLPSDQKRRLPVPTFVLLRKDGTVAGKTLGDEPSRAIGFPTASNLARLTEMLELCKDPTENANGEPTTTALTIGLSGNGSNSLQNADLLDVWKTAKAGAGVKLNVTLSGAQSAGATLTVKEIGDAVTNEIASASGDLTNLTLTATLKGTGTPYIYVQGQSSSAVFSETNTVSTIRDYTLTTALLIDPQEQTNSVALEAGTVATLNVVSNELYKLSVDAGTLTVDSGFVAEGKYYRATRTGTATAALSSAATFTYQVWKPGKVTFAQNAQTVAETAGTVSVSVSRADGSSEGCTVSVKLNEAASTAVKGVRYTWTDTDVSWADGETGTKMVTFALTGNTVYEGPQTVVLYLESKNGNASVDTNAVHTVTITDSNAPILPSATYTVEMFKGFAASWKEPVYNILEGGKVTLTRTDGKLPSGIKVAYDTSAKTFQLTGTPKKVGTYTASYTVTENRSGGKSTGIASVLTIIVKDPSQYNVFAGGAMNVYNLPLFASVQGTNVLAGLLTLKASSSGILTAKYVEGIRSSISMKGKWAELDTATTVASTELENTRLGVRLALAINGSGDISAVVTDANTAWAGYGVTNLTSQVEGSAWLRANSLSLYSGTYTVTLPQTVSVLDAPAELTAAPSVAPSGTAYLSLTMTSAYGIRNGEMRYKGVLPDGQTVSGKSTLLATDQGYAVLPIFFSRGKKDTLAVMLKIFEDGQNTYQDNPQIVLDADGVAGYWVHNEGAYTFCKGIVIYGGYYNPNELLEDCCYETYDTVDMMFAVGATADSQIYGAVTDVPSITAKISASKIVPNTKPAGFSLSLNQKTGIIRGSFKVTFSSGKKLTAKYQGIILPGWWDCGCHAFAVISRPFASGACWFPDRLNSKNVKRGMAVDINPIIPVP